MDDDDTATPQTGAQALLAGLKASGIDYLFANAGTDFPSAIEALAGRDAGEMPTPVTVPHETAGVGMAHGYYLATGRPQSIMVHVNVGLANAVMGVLNAASDNVPLVMMSGRTPLTEVGHEGSRMTPIQYGQEMYDQTSLVRDAVKFNYEMRYADQAGALAARAVSLALSEPRGPVYLSLPREPLAETIEAPRRSDPSPRPAATAAAPDPDAVQTAADILSCATNPLVICQRGDPEGRLAAALSELGRTHGIGTVEPFVVRNLLAHDDPAALGHAPNLTREADVILVIDSGVPWIEATQSPDHGAKIVHVGADPNFTRMPVRGYHSDLSITGDPAATVEAITQAMQTDPEVLESRRATLRTKAQDRATRRDALIAEARASEPMGAEWLSHCLSEVMDDDAVIFSELGLVPAALRMKGPNRLFSNPHSGGLGWALPAALGAQLARPGKLTIAAMGDGSYIFANPVACHQIAESLGLPVLIIVKNNAMWNAVRRSVVTAYPEGDAVRANEMPLTSLAPTPDFAAIAGASRAFSERVDSAEDLPAALKRALHAIRNEGRAALLDVAVAVSDQH
ncbi:thiamine pyrophosphate-requiring protein [Maritimibacter sp. UBA3975]|uniref:thiamine pyrophosphate-requiring protein n=1 Tax=Maritimibacter sp. UBA3975 TaxID=1946833 RepID=UPI000C0AEDEA|nr:thiamine pyrophosphate-requiring protein [Maritimibacter sp. UBA3975]MAM62242.1 acetolactate synthase [Maritimibacter sp.]|tara:strand:+ start:5560 stop:7269 length:1710 start_codon:yes stop_codon:yes gene_type:complete